MVGMRGSRLKRERDEKVNLGFVALIVASALILANASGSNPDGELTIISFEPANTKPSIEEGKSLRFSVNVSAPNETIPTYKWTLDGRIVSTSSNFWVYSPSFTESGNKVVKLIVSADNLTAPPQEWFVTVIDVNRPPKIDSLIPENPTPSVKEGNSLQFLASASDPDDDAVTYWWTLNGALVSTSNSWTYSPDYTERAKKEVELTVSDGKRSVSHEWIVTVENVNQPPKIDYFEPWERTPMVKEGESLTFFVHASDLDEDILSYLWTLNAIPVSTSDNWTYTPDFTESGVKNVEMTVSDGENEMSQKWIVTVENVNQPPEIVSSVPVEENPVVEEGSTLAFSINASDPDGDMLTYYWTLNETKVSASDSWIYSPDYTESGVKIVNVTVSDGDLGASTKWTVTVININRPPNITNLSPIEKNITIKGSCRNFSVNASDPDGDPPRYTWIVDNEKMSTDNNWGYCPDYPLFRKKQSLAILKVSDNDNLTVTKEWNIVLEPLVDPKVALPIIALIFIGLALFFTAPYTTSLLSRTFSVSHDASDNISKGIMFFVFAISPFYASLNFPYEIITLFLALIFFNESGKRLLPGLFVETKKRLYKLRTKEKKVKEDTEEEAEGKELLYSLGLIILFLVSFLFLSKDFKYFHMAIIMLVFGFLEYAKEKYLEGVTPTEGQPEKQRRERTSNTDPNGKINKVICQIRGASNSFIQSIREIKYWSILAIFSIFLLHHQGYFEFLTDQTTLYWFYSTVAQAFAAILGIIIAMYGVMVWLSREKAETIRNFVPGFKGFTIIFILTIIVSLVGIMIKLCPNFTAFEEHGFDLSTLWNNKEAIQNLLGIGVFEITLLLIPAALIYFHALIAAFLDVYSKSLKEEREEDDLMGYA